NVFLLVLETHKNYGKLQALLFWLDEIAGYPPPTPQGLQKSKLLNRNTVYRYKFGIYSLKQS
ncbi:MAG: hypothetical protein RIQ94_2408, partial [Pseudomonadota bacterium]